MPASVIRILNWGLAVWFAMFAFWQLNDPDAWFWVLLYSLAAVVCVLFGLGRFRQWFALLLGLIATGVACFLVYKLIEVEEVRELTGAIIVAIWMGILAARRPRSQPSNPQTNET